MTIRVRNCFHCVTAAWVTLGSFRILIDVINDLVHSLFSPIFFQEAWIRVIFTRRWWWRVKKCMGWIYPMFALVCLNLAVYTPTQLGSNWLQLTCCFICTIWYEVVWWIYNHCYLLQGSKGYVWSFNPMNLYKGTTFKIKRALMNNKYNKAKQSKWNSYTIPILPR